MNRKTASIRSDFITSFCASVLLILVFVGEASAGDEEEKLLPVNHNKVQVIRVNQKLELSLNFDVESPINALDYLNQQQFEAVSIAETCAGEEDGFYIFFRLGTGTVYKYQRKILTRGQLDDENALEELKVLVNEGWQYVDMAGIDENNDVSPLAGDDLLLLLFKRDTSLPNNPMIAPEILGFEFGKIAEVFDLYEHTQVNIDTYGEDAPGDGEIDTQEEFDYYFQQSWGWGLLLGFAEYRNGYILHRSNNPMAYQEQGLPTSPVNARRRQLNWYPHVKIIEDGGDNMEQSLEFYINDRENNLESRSRFLAAARLDHAWGSGGDDDGIVLVFTTNQRP